MALEYYIICNTYSCICMVSDKKMMEILNLIIEETRNIGVLFNLVRPAWAQSNG